MAALPPRRRADRDSVHACTPQASGVVPAGVYVSLMRQPSGYGRFSDVAGCDDPDDHCELRVDETLARDSLLRNFTLTPDMKFPCAHAHCHPPDAALRSAVPISHGLSSSFARTLPRPAVCAQAHADHLATRSGAHSRRWLVAIRILDGLLDEWWPSHRHALPQASQLELGASPSPRRVRMPSFRHMHGRPARSYAYAGSGSAGATDGVSAPPVSADARCWYPGGNREVGEV